MVAAETVATVATTVPAIKATVSQAGNVQSLPTLEGGIVRDQIAAGETVTLRERSADGQWFAVVDARAKEGWVHVDLLQLENVDVDTVPVSAEAELIAQTPAPASTVTNASTTAAVPNAPTLLAAPEHVGLGTTITVKGEGWPPQAQVALLAGLDGFDPTHELATVEPGTDGRWSTQVQFGTGEDGKPLPPGHYRIVAQTFTGDAFAIAEVELVP